MKRADAIIVGAGAAGLMAAYTLSKAGKKVIILEARNRTGGRMHTLKNESFFSHAELGAEFIHGNLPVTMQLLKEAGIKYSASDGEMWQYRDGKLSKSSWDVEGWDDLMKALSELEDDITIGDVLIEHFSGDKYTSLREFVTRFVSGYDTADPFKASAIALRAEWQGEDDDEQHRIDGGYGRMVAFLEKESRAAGAELFLTSIVKTIEWGDEGGKLTVNDGETYAADKIIVALPLGILKADSAAMAAVDFNPPIPDHNKAISQMGFGSIVKLLLEFKNRFWENGNTAHLGFVLSGEEIPTWWTQYPVKSNVLTGWLGGLPAEKKKRLRDQELLNMGIRSLANIFGKDAAELKNALVTSRIVNWTVDPFTLGSYAYDTVESHAARKVLSQPAGNTIYFAGEYLYEGPAMGTVEAALSSGMETAKKIL
jgi:monoamine oxidase